MKGQNAHFIKLVLVLFPSLLMHSVLAQKPIDTESNRMVLLERELEILRRDELIQSMTQRSLLVPGYFPELKALIARQAYNFWSQSSEEKLVSHLNIYRALHDANKYLGYDSINDRAYNQIIGHTQGVVSVKFGIDPNRFYSAGSDGKVLRWNLNDLTAVPEVIYSGDHLIRSIDISYDDQLLMVVTKDEGVIILALDHGLSEGEQGILSDGEIAQVGAFLKTENKYVLINKKGEVKIKGYDVNTPLLGQTEEKITSLAIMPQTNNIYAGTDSGQLLTWEEENESKRAFERQYSINAMAISGDKKVIAIGREKGDVILWDIEKDELIRIISGHQSAITDLDFHPEKPLLLTSSRDRTARVWDISNSRKLPIVLDDHFDWVMTASFDRTGDQIVTGSKDNFLRIWPVEVNTLAERICLLVSRNMNQKEWTDFVGEDLEWEKTCPNN